MVLPDEVERTKLIVVGGGLVGAAIAYGATRRDVPVLLLDQGDVAFRASRGNFGLVWVHSKGGNQIRYAQWSREASQLWPGLERELIDTTGQGADLHQPGGFWIGFSEKDVLAREQLLTRIDREAGGVPFEMMEPSDLRQYLPGLGPDVVGGSFCPIDGHANPLKLLSALHAGILKRGGRIISSVDVTDVAFNDDDRADFTVTATDGRYWHGERLVLAAGLGNADLAPKVGLYAPVFPEKGQVLITERLKPFLNYPTNKLRQTSEGSVQIGSTSEDVGLDDRTTTVGMEWLARRAVATFPFLSDATLVRAWGALRVLTSDGFPIYDASATCPGAFVVTSHSGVTLASVHALTIGPWVAGLTERPKASTYSAAAGSFPVKLARPMRTDPLFKTIDTGPVPPVTISLDGVLLRVPAGISVAAALLLAGVEHTRRSPVSSSPRAPYCMMGVCFECLMEIDGQPSTQACLVTVREGMDVRRQNGAALLVASAEELSA